MITTWPFRRYLDPSPAERELGLWVSACGGSGTLDGGPGCRDRALDSWGVVLVAEGDGFFRSRPTGERRVAAGALLWLFPGLPHSYGPQPRWSERWMLFDGPLLQRFVDRGFLDPAQAVQALRPDPAVESCFARACNAFARGGPLAIPIATAALHELIVRAHALRLGEDALGGGDPLVRRAVALLEDEACAGVAPEAVAARLDVPYPTLRRRFRRAMGMSLQDHAIQVRLRRARELLASGDGGVAEVAARCGFADPYYFARLFRKRIGMSPSHFRRAGTI